MKGDFDFLFYAVIFIPSGLYITINYNSFSDPSANLWGGLAFVAVGVALLIIFLMQNRKKK